MARPRISPDVLASKGVPLTLAGGLEVTLCFSFKALMLVEKRYGSLEAAAALMGKAEEPEEAAPAEGTPVPAPAPAAPPAPFGTVAGLLACGLAHEVAPVEYDGQPLDDPEVLADFLETDKVAEYSEAIAAAFAKAFPSDPTPPASADTPAETTVQEEDSRGPSGTGSLESGSASAKTSSGA